MSLTLPSFLGACCVLTPTTSLFLITRTRSIAPPLVPVVVSTSSIHTLPSSFLLSALMPTNCFAASAKPYRTPSTFFIRGIRVTSQPSSRIANIPSQYLASFSTSALSVLDASSSLSAAEINPLVFHARATLRSSSTFLGSGLRSIVPYPRLPGRSSALRRGDMEDRPLWGWLSEMTRETKSRASKASFCACLGRVSGSLLWGARGRSSL